MATGKPDFVAVQGGSSTVSIFTNTSSAFIMPTHIRATIGDGAKTFTGFTYDLFAEVSDANYNPLVGVGVTFTINPVNGAGGTFNGGGASEDVRTSDGSNGTTTGWAEAFPTANNTAGQFTVTATVGGHPSVSTTFTLTNVTVSPVPVINALDDYQNGAGLVPSVVLTSQSPSPLIIINGSGFTDQSQVYYNSVANPNTLLTTVFYNEHKLGAFVDPSLLPSAGSTGIYVLNPPSNAGGDGGSSNQSTLSITQSASAPTGSHIVVDGSTTIIAAAGYPDVLPTFHLVDGSGNVIAAGANNVIAAGAGNVIAAGAGNVIAAGAHNLIATSAGDVIASGAFNFTSGGGSGNVARASAGQQTRAGSATSGGAAGKQTTVAPARAKATPGRNTLSNRRSSGTYVATPDAKGIYYTPALLNNGTPGTYTRTISVPGIAQPITFTIINLKPNDGHPTAITGLSPTTAPAGGAAFTLTVNGTGFVRASVIAFGGIQLVTTFISATRLTAVVASDLIARDATPGVVVINPDPNGDASVSATFTIAAPPGVPTITSLSPASVAVGAPAYTLTVNGTNFTGGSTITFNGTTLMTTFVSATHLTAMVPTSAVATAGTAQVAVGTPPPGGGTASAVPYIIGHVNPEPPPKPPVANGGAPNPLPSARATVQPITGPPPAPVPPKR